MSDRQLQDAGPDEHWRRAQELPPYVFAALHKKDRAINPIAVVATVDADGAPRTAPFGSLRAVSPALLRLACAQYHDTYANLCRDGRVSVALLAPPDVAVSICGRARVVQERMDTGDHLAVVEIDVEEVKNDMMRRGAIESAASFAPPEELRAYYVGAIAEIEDMESP
jgi:hypothetical protein